MLIEHKTSEQNESDKQESKNFLNQTLDEFLTSLQQESIKTLPVETIRKQLDTTGMAIVTRDFNCGIRISKSGSQTHGYKYQTFTTNVLQDPSHPLAKKFGRKNIIIN